MALVPTCPAGDHGEYSPALSSARMPSCSSGWVWVDEYEYKAGFFGQTVDSAQASELIGVVVATLLAAWGIRLLKKMLFKGA